VTTVSVGNFEYRQSRLIIGIAMRIGPALP